MEFGVGENIVEQQILPLFGSMSSLKEVFATSESDVSLFSFSIMCYIFWA